MMDLNQIPQLRKIFILHAVVTEGSFRGAARRLKVTPSAISQAISSLENELSTNLFIRHQQQITPTLNAQKLLAKVADALAIFSDLFAVETSEFRIGKLDLGIYESIAIASLPALLKKLREEHGNFKFNVVIARTHQLLKKLRSGELCTAIVTDSEDLENVRKEIITEDELGIFLAKDSPFHEDPSKCISHLGIGSISPGSNGHPVYYKKFVESFGKNFRPNIFSDSLEVLKALTAQGMITAILPKKVVAHHHDAGNLREITHCFPRKNPVTGAHKIVLAYLDKCGQEEAIYLARLMQNYY